jgi:hypothetical protein
VDESPKLDDPHTSNVAATKSSHFSPSLSSSKPALSMVFASRDGNILSGYSMSGEGSNIVDSGSTSKNANFSVELQVSLAA